jgi:hypothetical protein
MFASALSSSSWSLVNCLHCSRCRAQACRSTHRFGPRRAIDVGQRHPNYEVGSVRLEDVPPVAPNEDDPFPDLDLEALIGLTLTDATTLAESAGVARIRDLEMVDGYMMGAIDLVLAPSRLDLWHENGRVVRAVLPSVRSAGRE